MFQFNRENVNVYKFPSTVRSMYLIYVPCVCTVYFLDQSMHNIYIYIYILAMLLYRKYSYMFRCTRTIFRQSFSSALLYLKFTRFYFITLKTQQFQYSCRRCECIEKCSSIYGIQNIVKINICVMNLSIWL